MIDAWLEYPCEDDSDSFWEDKYEEYKEKNCTCDVNEDCECLSLKRFIQEEMQEIAERYA